MSSQMGNTADRTPLQPHNADTQAAASGQKLKIDLDDLLEEIDRVLELNATAFRIVRRSGQRAKNAVH